MEPYKFSFQQQKEDNVLMNVYNCGYQKCTSGYHMGPVVRSNYLIHHVFSGKGTFSVGGQDYAIGEGDTFIIYPNTPASYEADADDPWEYYWVGFGGAEAHQLLNHTDFSPERPVISTDCRQQLRNLLLLLYQSTGKERYNHTRMVGYLYLFLAQLMEAANKPPSAQELSELYLKKALDYVVDYYETPITVLDIAAHVGVSRSHLYRIFMHHLKESPKNYLEHYRMNQGALLLEQTNLPVGEIAALVGYSDPLHFSKAFKKRMGKSPKAYRQQADNS